MNFLIPLCCFDPVTTIFANIIIWVSGCFVPHKARQDETRQHGALRTPDKTIRYPLILKSIDVFAGTRSQDNDVTWDTWPINSSIIQTFVQQFIQANNNGNIAVPLCWAFWWPDPFTKVCPCYDVILCTSYSPCFQFAPVVPAYRERPSGPKWRNIY